MIECNFNNVVMGEGISCFNRPYGDYSFPYLVGGKWRYGGSDTQNAIYKNNFMHSIADLYSDKAYTLTVLGGTWGTVEKGSLIYKTPLANSAPNSSVALTSDGLRSQFDINNDGKADSRDFSLAMSALFGKEICTSADLNRDGKISLIDLLLLIKGIR